MHAGLPDATRSYLDAARQSARHAEAECAAMQQVVNELRSESRQYREESMRSEFMRRDVQARAEARVEAAEARAQAAEAACATAVARAKAAEVACAAAEQAADQM